MATKFQSLAKVYSLLFFLIFLTTCDLNKSKSNNITEYNSIQWTHYEELQNQSNGYVFYIAQTPEGDLFCGDDYSIYKSIDDGQSWINCRRFGTSVYNILCIDNDIIFASTALEVYKSTDGGNSWEEWYTSTGYNAWIESMIQIDQNSIFLAMVGTGIIQLDIEDKSIVQVPANYDCFENFYIDPANTDIIYATNVRGTERSSDRGTSWIETNFPKDYYTMVNCILRVNDTLLLAGASTTDYAKNTLMFKSTDNGFNWEAMDIFSEDRLGNGIFSMVMTESGRIFAAFAVTHDVNETNGVFYSDDNGKNWVRSLDKKISVLDLLINNNGKIYAATQNGIFITSDENSWIQSNDGIANITVYDISISSLNDKYIATTAGLYNLTRHWHLDHPDIPYENGEFSYSVDLDGDDKIFTGDRNCVYISSDNDWLVKYYIDQYYPTRTYQIDSDDKGTIVCGTSRSIFISDDNGISWEQKKILLDDEYVYNIILTENQDIFAKISFTSNDGLYKSKDMGASWEKVDYFNDYYVTSLAKYGSKTILVGTSRDGLFISDDNGKKWKSIGLEDESIASICCYDKNLIFVATNQSLYVTADGGITWIEETTGLEAIRYTTLKLDHANNLFLGTIGGGLYYTDSPVK